jgi:putative hemolysin
MFYTTKSIMCVLLTIVISGACSRADTGGNSQPVTNEKDSLYLPNPASVDCVKKGGKVVIEKRGDGGEYGICLFEGNRQCEEWAML